MSDLERYLSLNYPVKVQWVDEENVFVADFIDLPGCRAYGKTVEQAYKNAQDAKKEWMEVTVGQGLPIPRPSAHAEHSGRILVRIPGSLHSMLADRAKLDGTSLNQYIVHLLSGALVGEGLGAEVTRLAEEVYRLRERILALTSRVNRLASQSQPVTQPVSTSSYLLNALELSGVSTNVEYSEVAPQVFVSWPNVRGSGLILTQETLGDTK